MNKNVWGPIYWQIIHEAAVNIYDEKTLSNVKRFYLLLPYILPCSMCANHTLKYIKVDNPNKCKTGMELFRWTFRFHNYTNVLLGKQTYYYNILSMYKKYPNHKNIYTFLNILNNLFEITYNIFYDIYYKKVITLLHFILKCKVCCKNIQLLKNIYIKDNFDILMYSHFPTEKSDDVYKYTGFKYRGIDLKLKDNKISGFFNNNFCVYKYYPIVTNQKYVIELDILCIVDIELCITCNEKPLTFIIDNKKYDKYILNNQQIKIEVMSSNILNEQVELLKLNIFYDKCLDKINSFVLEKINVNII